MCLLQQPQIEKTRVCMYTRFYPKYHCPVLCKWYQVACKRHSHSKMLLYHNRHSCQAIFLLFDLIGQHGSTTTLCYCILLITELRNVQLANLNFGIHLVQCSLVLHYSTNISMSSPDQNRYYHCELQCLKSRHPYFNFLQAYAFRLPKKFFFRNCSSGLTELLLHGIPFPEEPKFIFGLNSIYQVIEFPFIFILVQHIFHI